MLHTILKAIKLVFLEMIIHFILLNQLISKNNQIHRNKLILILNLVIPVILCLINKMKTLRNHLKKI
jgi:hypothetical protein